MISRRRILPALVATAAGAGVAAIAAGMPAPDDHIRSLVAELERAGAASSEAARRVTVAEGAAPARYPAPVPEWRAWARENHPGGPLSENCHGPQFQAVRAELASFPKDGRGQVIAPDGWARRLVEADAADVAAYYAPVRPAYDALVAERAAAVAVIDAEHDVPALDKAYEAAAALFEDVALRLVGARPATLTGYARKLDALWRLSDLDEEDREELAAEARDLIATDRLQAAGGAL